MGNGLNSGDGFIDLKKAFDAIDHQIARPKYRQIRMVGSHLKNFKKIALLAP